MIPEFVPFPSIPRLYRGVVITEKIDGTNAQIYVDDDGEIWAGARNGWVTPGKGTDNFGFAAWVQANREHLLTRIDRGSRLSGEWWGQGIQRGYGMKEKRFSAFNPDHPAVDGELIHAVPVLVRGTDWDEIQIQWALERLKGEGSLAAPGFMRPEGIVVYHVPGRLSFKVTLENDERGKSGA